MATAMNVRDQRVPAKKCVKKRWLSLVLAEYDYAYSTESLVDCTPEEVNGDIQGNSSWEDQGYLHGLRAGGRGSDIRRTDDHDADGASSGNELHCRGL